MTVVMLIHGWGLTPRLWDGVLDALPNDIAARAVTVDMGYSGALRLPAPCAEPPLVVGHSFGFAWAFDHVPHPWSGAIAVNGFARFTQTTDFPMGVPPRVLARMQSRLTAAPDRVVVEFLTRCGHPAPGLDTPDSAALAQGLTELGQCDIRAPLNAFDCPLWALAGDADPIVPVPQSQASFPSVAVVPGAGHLLPLTHPELVARTILKAMTP